MHRAPDVNFRENNGRTLGSKPGRGWSWPRRFAVGPPRGKTAKVRICGKMVRSGIRAVFLTEALPNRGFDTRSP